ncbi:hypothetical protein BD780_003666 [Clostridium tetanomorphum]|uniref:DUF3783 domain-containing protein n=2 Tax=Clostridium tetanomorphum TaxID=1553 RepID=A0A923ED48_CLOTT|nr:DUF3783 domain-containing protein [Clostridium tetanomorphum]MBC2398343.1 DUF3783 domain-containing protein [Clostridium tetanomorphum]MBP1865495.1 hypothetical protein [Clostridium tetanomorphum]NRS86441.1 hypothetical protein [Clostridium tetanomorphum]NRZ95530.1 hypothetical protein [Clostridium tetanomorphum]
MSKEGSGFVLKNDKAILVYGLDEDDKKIISKLIELNNLSQYIEIKKSMANMTLKDILNGLNLQIFDNVCVPEDKVILFNNFSDKELESAIQLIRSEFNKVPILAVVTPTSIEWTFKNLIEHLIEEREWFKNNNKVK